MPYKIISGKYETGTPMQQLGFCQLFGQDNILFKFDLYFHWFNIVHELGHCILETYHKEMDQVEEELYVNRFAVSYWKLVDGNGNLKKLEELLTQTLSFLPNPMPSDMTFIDFFRSMWENATEPSVALYGYFQLSCVLEALKSNDKLDEVLDELGIKVTKTDTMQKYLGFISSDCAGDVLHLCIKNLSHIGICIDIVKLKLVDNPEVQCASNY